MPMKLENSHSKKMFASKNCSIDYNFLDDDDYSGAAFKTTIVPFLGQKSKKNIENSSNNNEDYTMNSTKRTISTVFLNKLIDNKDSVQKIVNNYEKR
jgi:hypothetical protein